MPDRIIRDELLQSIRWLDLPTDTHRLIYENLILIADDYGNIEGGPRRLFRWMHSFTQVKTETDAIKVMSDLQDSDLARRYESEGREYWHLPRFKNSRWYWRRNYPQSPFDDDSTNEEKQRPTEKRKIHVTDTSTTRREGVGVGVGVGEDQKQKAKARRLRAPVDNFVLPDWVPKAQWDAWIEARTKKRNAPTVWAMQLAVIKLEHLRDEGHSPAHILANSAFNGWAGLFAPKETTNG